MGINSLSRLFWLTQGVRKELLKIDYDDNKFVDSAIAGNVDYIVTNDRHFSPLKEIDFPRVEIIKTNDF